MTESAKVCKVPVTFSPSFKTMICYILLIMTTLAWEHLPKSSIDNETVEEAIVRIVTAHNQDNTAHMQEGGSIDIHRKEGIIDHKAGSVLVDKETMSEVKFYTTFENMDTWNVVGQVTNAGSIGVSLYVENGAIDVSSIETLNLTLGNFLNTYKDMLFQTIIKIDQPTGTWKARFGQFYPSFTYNEGFGFIVENGVLKTFAGYDAHSHIASHNTISVAVPHVYRAQYIAGERKFYFYVDGVEVDSYVFPTQYNMESDTGIFIGASVGTASDYTLYCTSVTYAREI